MNVERSEPTQAGSSASHSKSFTAIHGGVQLGLGGLLLWWVVRWVNFDARQLLQIFAGASFLPLALAVVCFAMSMVLRTFQYRILLMPPPSNSYLTGIALYQNALLTFLPWRIGEMGFPLLLRKDCGIPVTSGLSMLIVVRLVDLMIVLTVALVGSYKLGLEITWLGFIFGAVVASALFFVLRLIVRRISFPAWLKPFTTSLDMLRDTLRFGRLLLLSVGIFTLSTFQSSLALRAMGLAVTVADIAVLNAVSLLAAVLPVHPPGGWGTIDSIQILVLQKFQYHPSVSIPVILAAHCFYTLLILAGGVMGWVLRGKTLVG